MPDVLPWLPLILGLGFLAFGLGFMGMTLRAVWRVRAARQDWLSTGGRMLSSELGGRWSSAGDGAPSYLHEARVHYAYTVLGRDYSGDRVTLQDVATSLAGPQRALLARYPAGATVTVYYDPQDPQRSALELRRGAWSGCFTVLGLVFALVGLRVTLGFLAVRDVLP